jgi:hypothetical protein
MTYGHPLRTIISLERAVRRPQPRRLSVEKLVGPGQCIRTARGLFRRCFNGVGHLVPVAVRVECRVSTASVTNYAAKAPEWKVRDRTRLRSETPIPIGPALVGDDHLRRPSPPQLTGRRRPTAPSLPTL